MMVDVGKKDVTDRCAHAQCHVRLPDVVAESVTEKDGQIIGPKGAVYSTAIIGGVLGAKKTSELIPFCHPLGMEKCDVELALQEDEDGHYICVDCTVSVTAKTGVEMEALTGCTVAALCVYDMLKALSHDIVIDNVHLVSKEGGKS